MSEDKFKALQGQESAETEGIARLEEENTALKDRINEERFIWIVIVVIFFDALIFSNMQSWGGPVSILILELIALLILARQLGVKEIHQILNRILDAVASSKK